VAGYQTVAQRNLTCAIRIRERRRELGLTQAEVVDRVERHGSRLSNQALSAIENGRRLAVGRLPDLAAALDCTVTYLIGLTTDPLRWTPDEPAPRAEPEPQAEPALSTDSQAKPAPAPSTAPGPEPALSASSRSSRSSRSSHAQDVHRTSSRRPGPSPVTPPHRNWILGPDVPDTSGELRARAHEADPAPTPRRPR
jgi:transcriptional regulator with XRE-family HTH domain